MKLEDERTNYSTAQKNSLPQSQASGIAVIGDNYEHAKVTAT